MGYFIKFQKVIAKILKLIKIKLEKIVNILSRLILFAYFGDFLIFASERIELEIWNYKGTYKLLGQISGR